MTKAAAKIKEDLSKLPAKDRAALAHYLIRSLDEEVDDDAESAWDEELARRLDEIKSGKAIGKPADQVMAEIKAKYS